MKQKNLILRKKQGSLLELTFALPILILIAITLIGFVRIFYTHNLVQNVVTDSTTKVATLLRKHYFGTTFLVDATVNQEIIDAIQADSDLSRIDLSFLDTAGNFTLSYEDLDGNPAENTLTAATRIYMDPGDGGALITYTPGFAMDPRISANCTTTASRRPMYFRHYKINIAFSMPITIPLFGINSSFTINEDASAVVADMSINDICSRLGFPI